MKTNTIYNMELSPVVSDYGFIEAKNRFENPVSISLSDEFNENILTKLLDNVADATKMIIDQEHEFKDAKSYYPYKSYLYDLDTTLITFSINLHNVSEDISNPRYVKKICKVYIFYEYSKELENNINKLIESFEPYLWKKDETPYFYTVINGHFGYDLKYNTLNNIKYTDKHIKLHYNDGFFDEYKSIVDNLTNKTSGLVLLHGEAGTGKSSILRQIIGQVCDKKTIIYIPSYLMDSLANPDFISFISEHDNSILILEDAEAVLKQRTTHDMSQAVSNILNMTNGLLNESMKIQIVATFNMSKTKLDSALLRPGRLINNWEFKKLSVEKTNKIFKYLDKDITINEELTISDIYNYEDYLKNKPNTKPQKKTMGI